MFGSRVAILTRILPNTYSLSGCGRFIKKDNSPSECNSAKLIRGTPYNRTYSSTVDLAKESELRDNELHEGHSKRQNKLRPSAAKTSLRRAALAAQISQHEGSRSTSQPQEATRESKTVTAYCIAEQYDLFQVAKILRNQGYELDPYGTKLSPEVVHIEVPTQSQRPLVVTSDNARSSTGDVFIFPSGALVAWDVPGDFMADLVSRTLLPAALNPHLDRRQTEDLDYLEDAGRESSGIRGDTIILGTKRKTHQTEITRASSATDIDQPQPFPEGPFLGQDINTVFAKIAFSSGLARSTKLAVLESLLNDYFESTKSIPRMLSKGSGRGFTRSFVLRKTGELLSIRAQLNLYSELTDSLPDLFWDSRHELGLERSYDQVGRALDVGVRIKTLNEKMDYSQEIASILRAQLSEQHGNRLEWIIIILITIEVGFEVRRIWKERNEHDALS